MARAYKWIGGIGYALSFIPYVNLAAAILVAIAWIMMGIDTDQKLFTVTGILMIPVSYFSMIFAGGVFATASRILTDRGPPPRFLESILALPKVVIILASALTATALTALAAIIAEIISHFRASRIFQSTWFKVGGWLRVAGIIGLIIAVSMAVWSALQTGGTLAGMMLRTATEAVFGILMGMFWPLILFAILGILATIFSAIAFFTIPEKVTRG